MENITSRKTMKCVQYLVGCFFIVLTFVNGFPSQCKNDTYFNHLKQMYLPCSECEDKQIECQICCSTSKPESVEASKSSNTDSVSSVKDESDKAKYRILHIFLQSFIITMVVCSLLVLVFVAYKVTRERRAAECQHQGNHFQNADANLVQEVYTGDPSSTAVQGGMHESTSQKDSSQVVNIAVNSLPDVGAAKHFSLNRKL